MAHGTFGTAVNCMDGRAQQPVIDWMKTWCAVDYVDMITEAGPIRALAEGDASALESIRRRVLISIEKHGSRTLAVVGHHDCAGNPVPAERQREQIRRALDVVDGWGKGLRRIGLYVGDSWTVEVVADLPAVGSR